MSFGFGSGAPAAAAAPAESGPELPETDTSEVGFLGVDKDCNIQFLPTPWPADALPQPTSSLLTISSTKGLVIGGGPEGLVLATTKSIRDSISAKSESGSKTKPFQPQGQISLPSRPTHVAFCAGDSALVVATESHNQIVVYDAASLGNGNPQPQISIQINGTLRALAPNPAPESESLSSFVALVTVNGDLLLADLKAGSLVNGPSGPVFRSGVASVTWSNKGKQMVAGLADGSCVQFDPAGALKAEIPRPPALEGNKHVSSLSWVENNVFFAVYTPNESEDENGMTPESDYYIIERRPKNPFLYRRLPMLCSPFGLKRTPAYHFIARLSNYEPGLQDALVVSSTVSTDVGLVTRASVPFKEGDESSVGVFTTTSIVDDTKQAILPMNEQSMETSTIGVGLDLTSSETVMYDTEKETKTPLPNLMILTNEGVLSSWWFLYMKAIESGLPYKTTTTPGSVQQTPIKAPAPPSTAFASPQNNKPAFGQPSFGQTGFGTPQTQSSVFGKPSAPTSTPAFGSTSAIGSSQKPTFGAQSALGGGSAFGSTTPNKSPGPAFGSTGVLGQNAQQFGQSSLGLGAASKPTFGQPGGLGGKGFSAFSSTTSNQSSFATGAAAAGGGFGSFAKGSQGSPFSSLGSSKPAESPFAKITGESPFGKPAQPAFGSPSTQSPFGKTGTTGDSKPAFGLPSAGFSLGTTFRRDEKSAIDNEPASAKPSAGSLSFGSSFNNMLGGSSNKTSPPTESMDDSEDLSATSLQEKPSKPVFAPSSTTFTPQSTLTGPPKTSGSLFGSQPSTTPTAAQTSQPTSLFGSSAIATPLSPLSSLSEKTIVPSFNAEQENDVEAPLPPDATSRAVYGPGDTSASSNVSKSSYEDAPLPPDFTKMKPVPKDEVDDAPLPPDFLGKSAKPPKAEEEPAPLPPDFSTKPKETKKQAVKEEEVPLPPDFLPKPKDKKSPPAAHFLRQEESISLPHESEGSDGDFEDSGEDITHDVSPPNEPTESESVDFRTSPESSFGGRSLKNSTGGLFTKVSVPETQQPRPQAPKPLFGEIAQPNIPPPKTRDSAKSPRSPSPVRPGARRGFLRPDQTRSTSAPISSGTMFGNMGRTPAKPPMSRFEEPLNQSDLIEEEESKAAVAESRRLASEAQQLSSDDEDTLRRAELERPLNPAPTLDPFMPRQEYSGESVKPGVPGQIERLYRDINSMVDTLGLNSRSIASYLLHEEENRAASLGPWEETIYSETPLDILDQKNSISDIENIEYLLDFLKNRLQEQRLIRAPEIINECQRLLSNDIFNLRDQCAHLQKTLDSYTDTASIRAQPLSAEQVGLQQDLRKASTTIHSQLTELEQGISLLRARIADSSSTRRSASARATKKPTVEAVTSTIATMMNMAESKSSDIDVLEAQMRKLGVEIRSSFSREDSPMSTPVKKSGFRVPVTPTSDGKPSAYQTPESASRFQSSVNGSARHSRLRSVNLQLDRLSLQDNDEWKTRARRRREIVGNLKRAIAERPIKVRTMDDE